MDSLFYSGQSSIIPLNPSNDLRQSPNTNHFPQPDVDLFTNSLSSMEIKSLSGSTSGDISYLTNPKTNPSLSKSLSRSPALLIPSSNFPMKIEDSVDNHQQQQPWIVTSERHSYARHHYPHNNYSGSMKHLYGSNQQVMPLKKRLIKRYEADHHSVFSFNSSVPGSQTKDSRTTDCLSIEMIKKEEVKIDQHRTPNGIGDQMEDQKQVSGSIGLG